MYRDFLNRIVSTSCKNVAAIIEGWIFLTHNEKLTETLWIDIITFFFHWLCFSSILHIMFSVVKWCEITKHTQIFWTLNDVIIIKYFHHTVRVLLNVQKSWKKLSHRVVSVHEQTSTYFTNRGYAAIYIDFCIINILKEVNCHHNGIWNKGKRCYKHLDDNKKLQPIEYTKPWFCDS